MASPISRSFRQAGWNFARAAFVILVLSRCVGGDVVGTRDEGINTPAVGMSAGGFGFAVTARNWTYDQSYTPDLSGGTLQVGLVIAGYTQGTGQLSVTDAAGTSIYSQNLAGNVAAGNNTVIHGTAPFHVRVTTTCDSGTGSLGINTSTTVQ